MKRARLVKKEQYYLSEIPVTVLRKTVRRVRLTVKPPDGAVTLTIPWRVSHGEVERIIREKSAWIVKHHQRFAQQPAVAPLAYESGESLMWWGYDKVLRVEERPSGPGYDTDGECLVLFVRPGSDREVRAKVLEQAYRHSMKKRLPALIEHYERLMGVSVNQFGIRKMKTRWGSCNVVARRIWLALELGKFPPEALEMVLVHELVHLLERSHNTRFYRLMDQFYPQHRAVEKELKKRGIRGFD